DALARRLKQLIKQYRHGDLARHLDHVDRETQLKQASVRKYVGRRSRGVAGYNQLVADEALGEYSRQHSEEIKHLSDPRLETLRCFCNPFHHYRCAHTRFSLCE